MRLRASYFHKRWLAVALAVIALAIGLPLGIILSSVPAGGDPGGAILSELLATKSDIPTGSISTTYISQDAKWIGSCTDATLKRGWSIIQGVTSFDSTSTVQKVQSYVERRLAQQGWKVAGVARRAKYYVDGVESYTYVLHWTKLLSQDVQASLSLQTSIPVRQRKSNITETWLIGGTANPIPPIGFCGGG